MGHCWSDASVSDPNDKFHVEKKFKEEGEDQFFRKKMNPDVEPEIERIKRVNMSDGLGREEKTRSIIAIQY